MRVEYELTTDEAEDIIREHVTKNWQCPEGYRFRVDLGSYRSFITVKSVQIESEKAESEQKEEGAE